MLYLRNRYNQLWGGTNFMSKNPCLLRPGIVCKILGSVALTLLLSLLFSSGVAAATFTSQPQDAITFQLDTGFKATTRIGFWLPVYVTLHNNGKTNFNGTIVVRTYNGMPHNTGAGLIPSEQRFEEPVSVAHNTDKQVTLYISFQALPFNPRGIMADLLDSHGRILETHNQDVATLNQGDISLGILTDSSTGFKILNTVSLPNQANAVSVTPLDASTLPATSAVLENFEVIVLADFSTSSLKPEQFAALQTWVNQGGVLIEVGGSDWQRTLSTLPYDLLPVTVQGTTDIPAGTHLLSGAATNGTNNSKQPAPSDVLSTSIVASSALLRPEGDTDHGAAFVNETVLATDTTPLVVQAHQGQGVICYLAFDPTQEPLASWSGIGNLWQHLLLRTLGDHLLISSLSPRYSSGPGALLARGGILSVLQPDVGVAIWVLVLLLFGYIAILGPIRLLIIQGLRRLQRPYWRWRILVSCIVLFSLFSYGLAFYQKGASLTNNTLSIVQINQSGTGAHVTTYAGVFVPSQGDFQVHLPVGSLVQPISYPLYSTGAAVLYGDPSTPIRYGANETSMGLLDSSLWSFHPLIFEQDRKIHGRIITNLALRNKRLVGVITNKMAVSLSDAYILMPHTIVAIGNLAAGETRQINMPLQTAVSGHTLAQQIAINSGLPASYFPYDQNAKPQTALQNHIAQLAAISGAGYTFSACDGSCNAKAIVDANKSEIITPRPGTPDLALSSGSDPLLLDGAPATLIGWSDQPLDGTESVTINNSSPHGFHENLVQMPLNVDLATPLNIAPDFLPGQLVEAQGNQIEMLLPGVYTMAAGSMDFEFDMPDIANSRINGFTITVPNTLKGTVAPTSGVSYLQARLYNWQTNTWEVFTLHNYVVSTNNMNAYVSPDGRVLLQLATNKTSTSAVYLSRPSLSLQV